MMNASQPHYTLLDYEASFDSQAAVAWAAEHPDLPVFAVALLLCVYGSVLVVVCWQVRKAARQLVPASDGTSAATEASAVEEGGEEKETRAAQLACGRELLQKVEVRAAQLARG